MSEAFSWPWTSLGSVMTFHGSGATPRGGKDAYKETGLPLVRSMNVYDLMFEEGDLAFIDDQQAAELDRVTIEPGDVLLNITGASVARCCLAPEQVVGGRVNQHVMILRFDRSLAEPGFVARALAGTYKAKLLSIAGSGATREALTKSDVENFEISLPPIEIQRTIAGVIDVYARLIENNRRRIETLEEMARLIYGEWFVHFRFPGHEGTEFVDSDLGPIPQGWDAASLSEVACYINRGIAPKYDEASPSVVINQRCIRDHRVSLEVARRNAKKVSGEKLVRKGDVLVNSTGVGTLGRVAPVRFELENTTVDSHVTIVRPREEIDLDYFAELVLSLEPLFESMGVGSTGQTELSRSRVGDSQVIIAPQQLRDSFGDMVRPMRQLSVSLLQENRVLTETRDLLLPRLVSGELNVSDLGLDLDSVA